MPKAKLSLVQGGTGMSTDAWPASIVLSQIWGDPESILISVHCIVGKTRTAVAGPMRLQTMLTRTTKMEKR